LAGIWPSTGWPLSRASQNGRHSINITIRFANPFIFIIFSAVLLLLGWSIGARWGHTANAGCALLAAIVILLVHGMEMAVLAGYGGYEFSKYLRDKDRR
jgi:hypothetical protein